jgi:hypothetical protein
MPLFDNFNISSSTGDFLNCTQNATSPDCYDPDMAGFFGMFYGIVGGGLLLAFCAYTHCCQIGEVIKNWRRKNAERQENSALVDERSRVKSYDGSKPSPTTSPTKPTALKTSPKIEPKSPVKSPMKGNIQQDIDSQLSLTTSVPDNSTDDMVDTKQAPLLIPLMKLKTKQQSSSYGNLNDLPSAASALPSSDNVRVSIN